MDLHQFKILPALIVFDLGFGIQSTISKDYTLWPYWVDTHVNFPVKKNNNGQVIDRRGNEIKLYPEVLKVLELLSSNGIDLGIASRTGEISGANDLLRMFDMKKFFKYREIYPGNKTAHFERFKNAANVNYEDMLFFDDEWRNIRDITSLGVTCIFVEKGTSLNTLKEGLKKFAEKKTK